MTEYPNLDYAPDAFAGAFEENEWSTLQEYLHRTGYTRIRFDSVYSDYIRRFHGGVPKKRYFRTVEGTDHVIERFLNFVGLENPLAEYNVNVTWSRLSDRLDLFLMPFAALFAGDYLCFDHSGTGRPRVVVWFHEKSRQGKPHTELVADTFEQFLAMLSSESDGPVAPSLSAPLEDRIFRLYCDGNEFLEEESDLAPEDAIERALECYQEAAALLPEPVTSWKIALDVYFAIGNALYLSGAFDRAVHAFKTALGAPGAHSSLYLHLRLGQAYFELGEMREAAKYLSHAFVAGGDSLFEDQDKKYLDFVQSINDTERG